MLNVQLQTNLVPIACHPLNSLIIKVLPCWLLRQKVWERIEQSHVHAIDNKYHNHNTNIKNICHLGIRIYTGVGHTDLSSKILWQYTA